MNYRLIGAIMIIAGCSGFGFSLAVNYRKEEQLYRELEKSLCHMENELKYHLAPLPELCRKTGEKVRGIVRLLYTYLAQELENQLFPEAQFCMIAALNRLPDIPKGARIICRELGESLGQYDLPGQLSGIIQAKEGCIRQLALLEQNRDERLRNYKTLGICAGTALAILFI